MTAGRRHPPTRPSVAALLASVSSTEPTLKGLLAAVQSLAKFLSQLWQYIEQQYTGLSAPHEATHLPSGADPLEVGAPVSIGMTNTTGTAESFSLSDHVHATPLTTKGDLLTVSGGALAKLGVGTDTFVLTADAAATPGIKWATTAAVAHEVLSATHSDTLTGTVVLGDVIHGNVTPKWARLAGNTTTTKKFLTQTGNGAISAVPSWGTIVTGDIPDNGVTYAKIQDVTAASRLIGRGSAGGSGDPEEISLGAGLAMSGTTLASKTRTVVITSDFTMTGTTLTDVTGLNFSVEANTDYRFEFYVAAQTSGTGVGLILTMNGPASPSRVVFDTAIQTTTQRTFRFEGSRAYDAGTITAGVDTADADCPAIVRGILRNGANAGTLTVRMAAPALGTVRAMAGSSGWIQQL